MRLAGSALSLALCITSLQAIAADAGLLTQMTAGVTYQSDGISRAATPFMKIRSGDQFVVPAGAIARILFFANGRTELWNGPTQFTIGDTGSVDAKGSPQVAQLPTVAGKQLNLAPDLSKLAGTSRIGGVAVRGGNRRLSPTEAAEVQKAKETYNALSTSSPPDDITPELYFLAVCIDFSLQDDMGRVLEKMQAKQPDNETIAALKRNLVPAAR